MEHIEAEWIELFKEFIRSSKLLPHIK